MAEHEPTNHSALQCCSQVAALSPSLFLLQKLEVYTYCIKRMKKSLLSISSNSMRYDSQDLNEGCSNFNNNPFHA